MFNKTPRIGWHYVLESVHRIPFARAKRISMLGGYRLPFRYNIGGQQQTFFFFIAQQQQQLENHPINLYVHWQWYYIVILLLYYYYYTYIIIQQYCCVVVILLVKISDVQQQTKTTHHHSSSRSSILFSFCPSSGINIYSSIDTDVRCRAFARV